MTGVCDGCGCVRCYCDERAAEEARMTTYRIDPNIRATVSGRRATLWWRMAGIDGDPMFLVETDDGAVIASHDSYTTRIGFVQTVRLRLAKGVTRAR